MSLPGAIPVHAELDNTTTSVPRCSNHNVRPHAMAELELANADSNWSSVLAGLVHQG